MCTSSFQNDNVRLSPLVVNVFTNTSINSFIFIILNKLMSGADPGFQVRGWGGGGGGGGAHLKKLRRAEGGANIFGVFRAKNYNFTPKNYIFSNFRGGGAQCIKKCLDFLGRDILGTTIF